MTGLVAEEGVYALGTADWGLGPGVGMRGFNMGDVTWTLESISPGGAIEG